MNRVIPFPQRIRHAACAGPYIAHASLADCQARLSRCNAIRSRCACLHLVAAYCVDACAHASAVVFPCSSVAKSAEKCFRNASETPSRGKGGKARSALASTTSTSPRCVLTRHAPSSSAICDAPRNAVSGRDACSTCVTRPEPDLQVAAAMRCHRPAQSNCIAHLHGWQRCRRCGCEHAQLRPHVSGGTGGAM